MLTRPLAASRDPAAFTAAEVEWVPPARHDYGTAAMFAGLCGNPWASFSSPAPKAR